MGGGGDVLSEHIHSCITTLSLILYKQSRSFNSKSVCYINNLQGVGGGGEGG